MEETRQRISKSIDVKLGELSERRKKIGDPIRSKKAIMEELIIKAHKREIKNANS